MLIDIVILVVLAIHADFASVDVTFADAAVAHIDVQAADAVVVIVDVVVPVAAVADVSTVDAVAAVVVYVFVSVDILICIPLDTYLFYVTALAAVV